MLSVSTMYGSASSTRVRPRHVACNAGGNADGRASRTDTLRALLKAPGILKGPCCHDGLSARLIERAGFPYAFMSGFCTSAARLGAPDTGLISYNEMMDQGRYVNEATRHIPIIGDGDTGYGNAVNVKRTVRGYAQAGFAGILIEDQIAPKSCGHVRGKRVTGREEAVSRIRAAVDAREEGSDILIVARTDARQAVSLSEALWRVEAFADAGADVLFIDALESVDEMRAFCSLGGGARGVPRMANNLEGGGKTPILPPQALEDMGFKLVAYPLSLLGVSVRAMEQALEGLKSGQLPPPSALGTFSEIQDSVGFPEYYAEEARYALSGSTAPAAAAAPPSPPPPPPPSPAASSGGGGGGGVVLPSSSRGSSGAEAPRAPVVEADAVIEETSSGSRASGSSRASSSGSSSSSSASAAGAASGSSGRLTFTGSSGGSGYDSNYRRNKMFRIRITDSVDKTVKLETRIPAGFLGGLATLVPQVKGMDLEGMIESALRGGGAVGGGAGTTGAKRPSGGGGAKDDTLLASFNSGGDVVEIFIE